jgi:hypothetical protein
MGDLTNVLRRHVALILLSNLSVILVARTLIFMVNLVR